MCRFVLSVGRESYITFYMVMCHDSCEWREGLFLLTSIKKSLLFVKMKDKAMPSAAGLDFTRILEDGEDQGADIKGDEGKGKENQRHQ